MFELLIVDDESFVTDNLSTTFPWEDLGIEAVHTANSANEALTIFETRNIHVVITDIRMPGMSGLELIDRIHAISAKTKCILLSGYSDFQYAQKAVSSQAEAYLLKPVREDELMETVRGAIEQTKSEWQEVVSRQRTMYTLNEHLPLLRGALLDDLLQGKTVSMGTLSKKIDMLKLKVRMDQPFAMMFLRMEQGFEHYDDYSLSLLEYSICNICEEIFGALFALWHSKDVHGNLVFVITPNDRMPEEAEPGDGPYKKILERYSLELQESVNQYLKGSVSVLISEWGVFPHDLYRFYQKSISVIRSHPDNADGFFIGSIHIDDAEEFEPLRTIQEPPTLMHLLEAGRWEAAEQKFAAIVEELRTKRHYIHEYIAEVAFMVSFSISHSVHKQGKSIEAVAKECLIGSADHEALRHIDSLERWGVGLIDRIKQQTITEAKGSQRSIIQKINEFVQLHLETDVSLQTIADHVFLHPAYVSKIYKMETGEGLSEYIYRLRMERAAHLLTETNEKIHEISRKTGYQNPSHFSRVFKKFFNMTPDDYRGKEQNA